MPSADAYLKVKENAQNAAACSVIIGVNGQCGDDPTPLYEAGSKNIACVIAMEALGQLNISRSSGDCRAEGTFGCITIKDGVVKRGIQAQSGQAYIVSQITHIGRCV